MLLTQHPAKFYASKHCLLCNCIRTFQKPQHVCTSHTPLGCPSLWHLHGFQMWAAFSWLVLGICPRCSSAFVVAMASPITSPFLRAFQHRNWAGFPAAFQPIQNFEGVRESASSKCLSPCQSKPWGQGWLSAASSIHTSALGLHTLMATAGMGCTCRKTG